MTTSELAEKIGIQSQSIHRRVCVNGSYFGVRPKALLNGRLIWPDDAVDQLSAARGAKRATAKGANHAPA